MVKLVVSEGNLATLICNVTSNPVSNIRWYYRNQQLNLSITNDIVLFPYHTNLLSVLTLHNVTNIHNDGEYTCEASNSITHATEKTKLTIYCEFQNFNNHITFVL